jgi:ABC-type dipeptide/oligopeptide/nickel transport system permease component
MIWFAAKTVFGAALKLMIAAAVVFFALELGAGDAGWAAANGRFWHWIGMMLLGDFGRSHALDAAVGGLILEGLAVTVPLIVLALVLAGALGVALGYAAGRGAGIVDRGLTWLAKVLATLPGLWIALLLILIFAATLHWLPAGGFVVWASNPAMSLVSLLLPALALALPAAGIVAMALRDAMKDARAAGFFRAALARGLSDAEVFRRHALPNVVAHVLDRAGPAMVLVVPASALVETVFYLPGMGRLLLDAVVARDVPVVEAGLVIFILGLLLLSVIVRVGRALVDTRLWRRTAA